MTGRKVDEWIGDHPDQAIPARVKARIFARCGGRCAITNVRLGPGSPFDYDHTIPLAMDPAGHRETNIVVVSRDAHKSKTADDIGAIRKADRQRAKHLGIWPKSKTPIRSRGFSKTRQMPEEA